MSVVEILRRNDPARSHITIHLCEEESEDEVAQALEQDESTTSLCLNLCDDGRNRNWDALLRVLQTRENLVNVTLGNSANHQHQNTQMNRQFLLAVQENPAIQSVLLVELRLSRGDMGAFLNNASVTKFSLYDCNVEPADTAQDAQILETAIQRSGNLYYLTLNKMDGAYLLSTLRGLKSRAVKLKYLVLWLDRNVFANSEAVARCNVDVLGFQNIDSEETARAFINIIPKVQTMGLAAFFGCAMSSTMRLELLESTKQNYCSLQTTFFDSRTEPTTGLYVELFDGKGKEKLVFYADRNQRLKHWIENPTLIPRDVWPEAVKLAQEAGAETLWRSLQAVIPVYESLQRRRKRKRPSYYEPS